LNIELTPAVRAEIVAELRKVRGASSKVAKNLGYPLTIVLEVKDEMDSIPRTIREEQFGGFGRPELRDHVVARKRAHESWDNTDPAIANARNAYEAGSHDMCTGRDGDWLILYCIPQQKVTPRPDYFRPEV
jgi:hypothetical protein